MAVTSRDMRNAGALRRVSHPNNAAATQHRASSFAYLATLLFVLVAANALFSTVSDWVQIKLDDLQYGRPRTVHLTAYVGHNEQNGMPTHLIGMNLDRRVVVIEIPGGDASKSRTIVGPYLFGAEENLTPVKLRLADMNGDTHQDLIVSVKAEEMIYINQQGTFRLITAEERQQLQLTRR